MSENDNSKKKDKLLEEVEKQQAELERSLTVAKVKAAHKQIEEIEKLRKRPIALSICMRAKSLVDVVSPTLTALNKPEFKNVQLTESAASSIEGIEKIYNSIKYDFQKNLDIGEEGMVKMFPMIKLRKDNYDHVTGDLLEIFTQMSQMMTYCGRLMV